MTNLVHSIYDKFDRDAYIIIMQGNPLLETKYD